MFNVTVKTELYKVIYVEYIYIYDIIMNINEVCFFKSHSFLH